MAYVGNRCGGSVDAATTAVCRFAGWSNDGMKGKSFILGFFRLRSQTPARWTDTPRAVKKKNADMVVHPKVFGHVGLLVNEPPGPAELLLI